MLLEGTAYALSLPGTPAPFRPYLFEAIGLWARGRRQRHAWAPHLKRTRAFITSQIAAIPHRRAVAVLGSGPLFDVPLAELSAAFERVYLVDRAHPAPVGWRLRAHPNVSRCWRELNAQPLAEALAPLGPLDWVISLNLVSQLALAVKEGEERRAIDAHLEGLSALPCRTTLVADTAYRRLGRNGRMLEAVDLLFGRLMPEAAADWDWEVAPFGEESRDARRLHRVSAWPDWRKATAPA